MCCLLSPFCGVGKLTGFEWDFKYLLAARAAKSFVTSDSIAIQTGQPCLFVYLHVMSLFALTPVPQKQIIKTTL